MKTPCLFLLLAAAAMAADTPGLKPKFEATGYPAHAQAPGANVGARLLTPEQVRGAFSTDLNRGYVVVEVAVYPQDGDQLDLGPGDFTLRLEGTDISARPAAPKTIAQVLSKAASGDRDIDVYPTVGVGYESGRGYDPMYGGRGGWTTGAGVGVGVGRPRGASTEADRKTMALELGDQQLPEKMITAPVAGYLYFPLAAKNKRATYILEYQGQAGRASLTLH
ncbi:MAG TPA: hypothetical protein VF767_10615 [Bryobacteraceae bacterium]